MPKLATEPPELHTERRGSQEQVKFTRPHRWLQLTLIVIGILVIVGIVIFAAKWPFTRAKVMADLQEAVQGTVQFGSFHQTYFPPGCVAENVVLRPHSSPSNPITVRKLTIQGSYHGLFTKHVPVFHLDGVHVVSQKPILFFGLSQNKSNSKATIDEYVFTDSTLEMEGGAGKPPLKFEIARLILRSPNPHGAVQFETTLRNPKPQGELHISGSFGPLKKETAAQTPISGMYSFRHADLGAFHGIAGILGSDGNFQGTLQQFAVGGKTEMPDFEVKDAGHKITLNTQFQALVNGKNGDVQLKQVMARLGGSDLALDGTVARSPGQKGKITSVDLLLRQGRIQDFLFLFLKDRVPPMTGQFSFRGHAILPPGKEPFDQKVELEGDFGIGGARMSNPKTQGNLEQLSERAEGEKDAAPERIVSDLKGHVVLRNGIATFSHLSFKVPGAKAKLHGTYSLVTHQINLHGRLLMQAQLHQATGGMKSFLLKIINPFLKKNHHGGGVVALSVTGVYPHPIYKTAPIADPI